MGDAFSLNVNDNAVTRTTICISLTELLNFLYFLGGARKQDTAIGKKSPTGLIQESMAAKRDEQLSSL